jgi:arylformamidase
MLGQMRVVDLTRSLDEGTVLWPGSPAMTAETLLTVEHDGFYNRRLSLMEHSGTHFDAPCHMCEGGETVDAIDPARLVRPVAMIDVSAEMTGDPDATLTVEQVRAFEAAHGAPCWSA